MKILNRSLLLNLALAFGCLNLTYSKSEIPTSWQIAGPRLYAAEVEPGDLVPPDLKVYTENGEPVSLLEVIRGKYTVLVTGCLTCPVFHRTYPGTEAVYQDYKDRDDIQFFYLYKSLAHPEYNGYVRPANLEERLAHIAEAKRVLDTSLPWLCDGMDNQARFTLGLGPNSHLIFDPEGRLLHALGWTTAEVLRQEIVKRVGDSATHTEIKDLHLKKQLPALAQKSVPQKDTPWLEFDELLVPVQIAAKTAGNQPYYVKPRAEVTRSVLENGNGQMYLGFHLDPIHHVHWNNLATPLHYELQLPGNLKANPEQSVAAEVKEPSDSNPREFAVELTGAKPGDVMELTFHYFACSDEEGWCVPATQSYKITLKADENGGGTMGRSFGRIRGQEGNGQTPEEFRERILLADVDGDGIVHLEDFPPMKFRETMKKADQDHNGILDEKEIEMAVRRMGNTGRNPNS